MAAMNFIRTDVLIYTSKSTGSTPPVHMSYLHVSPAAGDCVCPQEPQNHWVDRITDVYKRRPVSATTDGILLASLWVSPAPDIIPIATAAKLLERHKGQQVDIFTLIFAGFSIDTGHIGGTGIGLAADMVLFTLPELLLFEHFDKFHPGIVVCTLQTKTAIAIVEKGT